jgi:hypothetical protein
MSIGIDSPPLPEKLDAFRNAEWNLYLFTALQNAGYVVFFLLYHDYMEMCDPQNSQGVWLDTSLLFSAALIGNLFSVYAGFASDAHGHGRGIRKSFDFGVIHGVILTLLPLMPWQAPPVSVGCVVVFLALLVQGFSSAYVNASYHAWFVASAHNMGYHGTLDSYTSRRRLVANLVWLLIGVAVLWPFQLIADLRTRIYISGALITTFYLVGAWRIRKVIWSEQDMGSFESASTFSDKTVAKNWRESFSQAWSIIRHDGDALTAAALYVATWTLGIMVLYFWQAALAEHPASRYLIGTSSVIWVLMTLGRVLGNSMAVLPAGSTATQKESMLRLGGWFNGLSMVTFAILLFFASKLAGSSMHSVEIVTAIIAVLLIVLNRVGQEMVLPFAYARLHESKSVAICQNRAAVESFLSVWTSIPLVAVWGLIFVLENVTAWKPLIIGLNRIVANAAIPKEAEKTADAV